MPTVDFKYKPVQADPDKYGDGFALNSLSKRALSRFAPVVLGLGDVSQQAQTVEALAAIFDLHGFTKFCNQPDSHLTIPEYLNMFLSWLFESLRNQFTEGEDANLVRIWGSLPFLAKFLGDGVLFLWNTDFSGGDDGIRNIVGRLCAITEAYPKELVPKLRKSLTNAPERLRCGIARGQVVSIGDGHDCVGPCINAAARLQKLSLLSFAASRTGLDLHREPCPEYWNRFILRRTSLRGIGQNELVYVRRDELESLPQEEAELFSDP